MGKYLSLEEMKKKAGLSNGGSIKDSGGYASLEELKSYDLSKLRTGSIGKMTTAYDKYKEAQKEPAGSHINPVVRTPMVTNATLPVRTIAERKQSVPLPTFRDAAERTAYKTNLQKQADAYQKDIAKYTTGWRANAVTTDPAFQDTNKKLSDIQKQLAQISKLEQAETYGQKYLGKEYGDHFWGQTFANLDAGRMGQDSSMAWNAYLNNPTEANRKYAENIDAALEKFRTANAGVLDSENAVLPWISQSFANYVPQLVDQTKAGVTGAAIGAAAGTAAIPGLGTVGGAKAGYMAGVGMQSYDLMRGSAFKALLDAGVDEETALAAASDEALVSALIEMADAGVDIMTMGGLSALKSGVSGMFKTTAGKSAYKKALAALGKYGINVASEATEEGLQEAVSIGNAKRTAEGQSGLKSLTKGSFKAGGDAMRGDDLEARSQILAAAGEGAKIAAVTGGVDAVVSKTGEAHRRYLDAKYSKAEDSAEEVATDTNVGSKQPQNHATGHETAISDELNNSAAEMKTQPTEAQKKQAQDRDNYLERYYHENGASILRAEAEKRGSLQEAEDIYRPYYIAGLTGQAFDSVKGAMAVNADRSVAMEMYRAGVSDKLADMTARIKGQDKLRRSKTGVNLMTEAITDQQKALANLVAKVGRMNVTIVDTLGKDGKVGNNGEYTRGTNEVVIALDAESFSGTLFHETVHYIKQANAKGYERMAEAVFRMAAEMDGVSVSDYLRRYESMEAYGPAIEAGAYNFADVTEELVADAFQMLAADEARCRSLIAEIEQSNPTVLEQIREFLQKMLETLEGLVKDGRFHAFAEDINKDIENTKKLQKIFAEELRKAGRTTEAKTQTAEQTGDAKFSVRLGMTEDERYEELKNREIVVYSDTETKKYPKEFATIEELQKTAKNSARKEIKKLAENLGVLHKEMKTPEVEVEFILSGEGLRESFNKQAHYGGSYLDFAKAVANLDKIMETAVLLEEHEDKYKGTERESRVLEKMSVLFGAFRDGADIIPVQMEIKKSSTDSGRLYMTVAMTKIEAGVIETRRENPEHGSLLPTSTYRLADIFREINVADKNFLKYVPEKFLNKAQREAKEEALQAEAKKIENLRAASDSKVSENVGVQIDEATESAAPKKFSRRTWEGSDYVTERNKAAKEMAEKLGITQKKAKAYIDAVNGVAKMIADNPNILDYESNEFASAFVSNSEYGGSIDFSTICKKRRWMTGTLSAIQKALPNTALTAEEVLDIRNRMKEKGYEVSCGLCYVEGSRTKMGEFTSKFIELYKRDNPPYVPTMAEMNTPEGLAKMMKEHPEVYDAYEYFYNHYGKLRPDDKALFASQQKPKLYQLATEYKGEVLDKFKDADGIELKNKNGGLRLQSFSDFEVIHLIDAMQVITDMARVGLAGQAYTKVPDFAWALGDTGLKINLSLIAKEVNENGRLILDEVEGMPRKDAEALRNRYSDNVGTIIVVFNDEQLYAAMKDDFIDFIIPFHRSQWKKSQYPAMGLPAKVKDYTYQQNEKLIKKTYHEWRGKMVLDKPTNYMPNEYWDFTKSGKENAENYLQMCAENNKRPKFYKLLKNNGNGSYSLQDDGSTDGYWKLLIDFKMYNNEGKGVPQGAVKPEFNMDEAYRMLQEYGGDHAQFPVAQDVVDEFVAEKQGAKFSVRESGEAELQRENASLIAENKHLQKMVENLKHQFKLTDGTTPDQKSVRRVANAWLKQTESKADLDDFSMKLGKITEYFAKAESKNDREHAMAALRVLVRDAMEQAETLNTKMRDEYSGLIKQIRNTSLKVTDELRSELENYGGYNAIRRENFSRMNLSTKGKTSIDSFYYDLCQEYPEFFREEDAADEAEQLMNIIAVLDTLKPVAENPYGYDIEEYVYDETMGLLDKMAGIQMEQTFADKKKADKTAALQKLKTEFNTSIKAMRDEVKAAQEEAERAYLAGRMVEGRHKVKEIAKAEAKHQRLRERTKKATEARKARADRKIIEKEAKIMLEWLANPTDTKHIPEALKKHTAYLLNMFTTGKDDRLTNLQLVVKHLAEEYRKLDPDDKRNEDMTGRYIEYDDNLTLIAEALEESLKKRTDGLISLNNLTAEEMSDLKDMIRMLKKTLMEANKLLTMEKKAEVANVSADIIADMQPRKGAVQAGRLRVMNDFFKLDMLDANSFFKRMSKTAHATIYRSFRKGLDTKIRCVKEAADFMNELVDKKTVKQWRDTAPEKIELMGGTVYLNVPQIMSVYCLARREQGKQHLYTGGVVGDTDYQKKRLSKETREAMRRVTGSQLTEADVKMITDRLTAEQKKVAREMQRFLSERAADWGNDVTMQLFGYKKFNEKNYFPIKVDGDTTMVTVGKPKDATRSLRSLGMTKQLKKNAQNPVMARDIFTVFAEHIDQMSSYAAFVPAISDTNKILNYKTEGGDTVKKELRRVMGDGGIGYIHKLVDMINGAVAYSNDGAFAKAMVRNMKIASVGFNARVVAQQPASIVRASAVIDPQYIAVTAIPTKKDWELIYRYAPISWWKEQGYYDTNIGRSIESLMTGSSGMEKVTDASMWAAGKADKFTWGWMWKACEKQIQAKQPELSGEAFYEAVGELFSRAIDDTQVVDSPLHRSQKMREKGLFTQMTTSFMSEPTKTYNMATTAMLNLMRENTPENRKQFAKSLWILTASAAATAAMAGIVDAGRDDDDEKWADKWLEAFLGDYSEAETKKDMATAFFGSNFGASVNPMNYIPYMKDLMSIFDGYDIKRTDMDWAVDIKNAMNRLHKYAEGDSEYTAYATFVYVAGSFSKVFGIPAKSIMRDMEALVNWSNIHLIGTEEAKYKNSARNLAVGSKKNMSHYTERYMRAYQNGDKVLAQKIYNDMIKGGIDEEELKAKIASNTNDMMFDAHLIGNTSEFQKFWKDQKNRGKEDSGLRTSMRSRYKTMYENALESGNAEAQRQARKGFKEFGGKDETLDKLH